jgi:hypothetical protein
VSVATLVPSVSPTKTSHPGGYQRTRVRRAPPLCRPPDRDGGRRLLAEGFRPELPRMGLVWIDRATRAGSASGPSWVGVLMFSTTATGGCGAVGWRKSREASWCFLADGS